MSQGPMWLCPFGWWWYPSIASALNMSHSVSGGTGKVGLKSLKPFILLMNRPM